MEKLGERFVELLDTEEIDRDEAHGQVVSLVRTREIDDVAGEHLQFVMVSCPSTGRHYALCVEPTHTNAWAALASTFPNRVNREYAPVLET